MATASELNATQLRQRTDPEQFHFATTADLEDLSDVLGQPRVVAAMQFGIGMAQDGYNIFALGPTGTGKRRVIRSYFEKRAEDEPVPDDWCYVNNFEERHKPRAIRLPAGKGLAFRNDVQVPGPLPVNGRHQSPAPGQRTTGRRARHGGVARPKPDPTAWSSGDPHRTSRSTSASSHIGQRNFQ